MRKLLGFLALALAACTGGVTLEAPADAAPSFYILDVTCPENQQSCTVQIVKKGKLNNSPSVLAFSEVDGTAKAGTDYIAQSGNITFQPADKLKVVNTPLIDDDIPELTEYLTGKIRCVSNCRLGDGSAKITITDSDVVNTPPPAPCPAGTQLSATTGHCEPIPPPPPPPSTQTCPDGTVILVTEVCPQPPPETPPASGSVPSPTLAGAAPIASETNTQLTLITGQPIPITAKPDDKGAFRFICFAGQLLYDDPIVYPGRPGKSHLHQFYGNTAANASSTYASLRAGGTSTCNWGLIVPQNRSAYWVPAMLDGRGNVVRPDFVSIYYKQRPASDPKCNAAPGTAVAGGRAVGFCVPLPNAIRFIFGYNMLDGSAPSTGLMRFNCQGPGSTPGSYPDIVTAARYCPVGAQLGFVIEAPDCWNGTELDSANHRSHIAYGFYDSNTGQYQCPVTHPYVIPTFTLGEWFTVDASLDRSGTWTPGVTQTWSLSSDNMEGMPQMRPGKTGHADFWMAWDPDIRDIWDGPTGCIGALLNCSAGQLGDGRQLPNAAVPQEGWLANPHSVPVPARP